MYRQFEHLSAAVIRVTSTITVTFLAKFQHVLKGSTCVPFSTCCNFARKSSLLASFLVSNSINHTKLRFEAISKLNGGGPIIPMTRYKKLESRLMDFSWQRKDRLMFGGLKLHNIATT